MLCATPVRPLLLPYDDAIGGGGDGLREAGNGTRAGVLGAGGSTTIADVVDTGFVVDLGLFLAVEAGFVVRFFSFAGVAKGDEVISFGDDGA